ncbi:NAD dependent epimerase/dehydratase family protein [Streptomyces sp. 3214.6]|nr:NAD dependent epimerase/dehydratase family protein [Streptomyces sp. 3214.6]
MSTILVTGGSGTLGRLVTARLRADGHEVRVLSRRSEPYAVDLRRGGAGPWGAAYRGFRTGGHLAPERAVGKGTFENYLTTHTPH